LGKKHLEFKIFLRDNKSHSDKKQTQGNLATQSHGSSVSYE